MANSKMLTKLAIRHHRALPTVLTSRRCCGGTGFATATVVVAEPILEVHTRVPS
jgi:hypothetical protein